MRPEIEYGMNIMIFWLAVIAIVVTYIRIVFANKLCKSTKIKALGLRRKL